MKAEQELFGGGGTLLSIVGRMRTAAIENTLHVVL